MIFVDTNYFLRFLLAGKSEQQRKALELFKEGAEGKVKLFTSLISFFEIYWVLSTFYKKDKKEVKNILLKVLEMDFIDFFERENLTEAVLLMDKCNYDLEDSYNLCFSTKHKAEDFKTFDKNLEKIFKSKVF